MKKEEEEGAGEKRKEEKRLEVERIAVENVKSKDASLLLGPGDAE